MAKIVIEIETGNDAMQTYDEIAEAIADRLCRRDLYGTEPKAGDSFTMKDGNGNAVGRLEVSE